ncbi:MAG: M20/M25/M40 family metallo-hydrolase [Vicinamibacterales bacterium]
MRFLSPLRTVIVGVAVAAGASYAAHAQSPAASSGTAARAADLITERDIRAHMEFLASDALNGRGSGTRDEWITATYIGSMLHRYGVEPFGDAGGFVQQIDLAPLVAVAAPVLRAGALRLTHGQDLIVQALGQGSAVSGPLHRYQRGTPVPDGAVLLMPADATSREDRTAANAAAMVLSPETPQVRSRWDDAAGQLPATSPAALRLTPATRTTRVVLSAAAFDQVQAVPEGTTVTLDFTTQPAADRMTHTWNALGKITGADPARAGEVIVLSAHLDHIGARQVPEGQDGINNGADDDASGTIAVLALARALAMGPRPARTIVFALFGSEERGGYGAGYFVDLPVVPLDHIVADLQFEMLGRPDPLVPEHHLWLTGYERSDLGAELAKHGALLVADPHPDQSFFTRSDNIRFARRGVVAHTVSSFGLHTDYHRPSDEIGTIDFAHMTDAIRSMLDPIRGLADSAFRPEWVPGGCPAPCR